MGTSRKLQTEIDRTLKKVDEGVLEFDQIWEKVYTATQQNQKEKFEGDLKKEIKKLQRHRDSIKSWIASNDIKDKRQLLDARKLIETKMEQFKVCEKETKTKAFSKEGLARQTTMDPEEAAKIESRDYLQGKIDDLTEQIEGFEADLERFNTGKKKKGAEAERCRILDKAILQHRFHIGRLEQVMRALDNGDLYSDQVDNLKEDVDFYVETCSDPDAIESAPDAYEYIYEELCLDVLCPAISINLKTNMDNDTAEEDDRRSSVGGKAGSEENDDEADMILGGSKLTRKASKSTISTSTAGIVIGRPVVLSKKEKEKERDSRNTSTTDSAKSSYLPPAIPSISSTVIGQPHTPLIRKATHSRSASITSPSSQTGTSSTATNLSTSTTLNTSVGLNQSLSAPTIQSNPIILPPRPAIGRTSSRPASPAVTSEISQPVLARSASPYLNLQSSAFPELSQTASPSLTVVSASDTLTALSISATPNNMLSPKLAPINLGGDNLEPTPEESLRSYAQQHIYPAGPESSSRPAGVAQNTALAELGQGSRLLVQTSRPIASLPLSNAPPPLLASSVGVPISNATSASGQTDILSQVITQGGSQMDIPLLHSMIYVPQRDDTERPKLYLPRNPYRAPPSYPTHPSPAFQSASMFKNLPTDTLFFIFYYQQGTYQQYLAAKELKSQSWRYHKKYMTWFQRHEEPKVKLTTEDYEQGAYVYFDYETGWCQRIKSDFTFEYSFLEDDIL